MSSPLAQRPPPNEFFLAVTRTNCATDPPSAPSRRGAASSRAKAEARPPPTVSKRRPPLVRHPILPFFNTAHHWRQRAVDAARAPRHPPSVSFPGWARCFLPTAGGFQSLRVRQALLPSCASYLGFPHPPTPPPPPR